MKRGQLLVIFCILSAVGFQVIFLSSCKSKSLEGTIVFTQVPAKLQEMNLTNQESSGQNLQSRIAALYQVKSGVRPVVLTNGFYSASSPDISCDGTGMLFSARKKQGDAWQIWEMDLTSSESRQVISIPEDCFDPVYLPNGRVFFSKQVNTGDPDSGIAMASCNSDGSDLRMVTFNPYNYSIPTILQDGRVLALSSKLNPDNGGTVFMVLRPDGTKNALFYESSPGNYPQSRGREITTGRIVFVESQKSKSGCGALISISYNRPLHTYINLSSGIEGSFNSVFPQKTGKFLVSYRKSGSDRYGLYEFDPENKTIDHVIYASNDFDIAEVVAVEKHERPKKLPSEVDMGVKTGLLLCQDVDFMDNHASINPKMPGVNRIRIVGRDSTLGEIDAERDGSFYLKVIADTPIQIQAIDNNGNIIGKPCGWIYLRPNERRGCIGCHEDPELVPENKVPLAVKLAPINIPVHISKVVEKKVSLE